METTFKCTTCIALFPSNQNLKDHHKCDWHRYNLKRKLAGMPAVPVEVFQRKLELLASTGQVPKGVSHLKDPSGCEKSSGQPPPLRSERPVSPIAYPSVCHSLFDNEVFDSVDENVAYMSSTYSFFIPDMEYLKDKEGLITYLGAKLYEGYQCLYCNRPFKSLVAVRNHMITKGHTSIGVSSEEQEEELEPFYDFSTSYDQLVSSDRGPRAEPGLQLEGDRATENDVGEAEEDEWEYEKSDSDEEDIEVFLARKGIKSARINEFGNLILPNGSEVCHRSLAYVYRQRLPTVSAPVRLALTQAKILRQLTENGERGLRTSEHYKSAMTETFLRSRQRKNFDLKVGVKGNKLGRHVLRQEKCFV